MPTKWLPDHANLDHLKHQAKDFLRDVRAEKMSAFQRLREFHPRFSNSQDDGLDGQSFSLSDAQLTIAREYGYPSWPRLRAVVAEDRQQELSLTHNERLPDGPFKQALDFMDAGEVDYLVAHLARHPGLTRERVSFEGGNYFATPSLLEFLPENPNRQGRLPKRALEIADILLQAGAKDDPQALNETVMLAASGRVCREAGIQSPLLRLLCAHGADPEAGMNSALIHGEFEAVRTLLDCGAVLDLGAAAALGDAEAVARLIPDAGLDQLQLAVSLASCFDRPLIIATLLAAGADPNRYNPPGGHSHCTPLHSAVAANEAASVAALVEGGARGDMRDIHHNMTPLDWANYLKHEEIAAYLTAQAS